MKQHGPVSPTRQTERHSRPGFRCRVISFQKPNGLYIDLRGRISFGHVLLLYQGVNLVRMTPERNEVFRKNLAVSRRLSLPMDGYGDGQTCCGAGGDERADERDGQAD